MFDTYVKDLLLPVVLWFLIDYSCTGEQKSSVLAFTECQIILSCFAPKVHKNGTHFDIWMFSVTIIVVVCVYNLEHVISTGNDLALAGFL